VTRAPPRTELKQTLEALGAVQHGQDRPGHVQAPVAQPDQQAADEGAFQGDHLGMVDQSVDHGGGDVVAEHFTPAQALLLVTIRLARS
jgi:hypothetical protein